MDELPPFFPPVDPSDRPAENAYITSPVEPQEIEDIIKAGEYQRTLAYNKITDEIDADLFNAQSVLNANQAAIYGQVDNALDQSEAVYLKALSKVNDDINRSLTESYQTTYAMGIPIPSDEAIALANETGEYLASNFLTAEDFAPVSIPNAVAAAPQKRLPFPTSQRNGNTVLWICGTVDCGTYWVLPNPFPAPIPNVGDYEDFLMWVYSLGSPWYPGFYTAEPSNRGPGLVDPGTFIHSTRHWAAYAREPWDCEPCVGTTPPPPTPPPPTPPPPGPTPPPPLEASCPVVVAPSVCEAEQATKLYGKTWDILTTAERAIVANVCGQLAACGTKTPPEKEPKSATAKVPKFDLKPPAWCRKDIAEQLATWSAIIDEPAEQLKAMFGIQKATEGGYNLPPWLEWVRNVDAIPWWAVDVFLGFIDKTIDAIDIGTRAFTDLTDEQATRALSSDIVYQVFSLLNKYIGFPPGSWLRRMEKTVNYFAPENIPSTADALEGLLSGVFTEEQAKAYVAGNNDCPGPYKELAYGRRTRPNINEIIDLWFRERIDDRELEKRAKEVGLMEPADLQAFVDLKSALPGVADIIRFMVRDVADPKVIEEYGLDSEFSDKWQGLLAKYGSAQGIQLDLAKYFWRAHWEFPSPTQLYEMLHRLRPGRVDPSIEVDANLVEKTLGINDYAPIWRKRLMAVSYSPLTRTDAQRAFAIGAIDEKELRNTYLDEGYNEENADILVRFTKKLVDRQRRTAAGIPGPKDWIREYVAGMISRRELRNRLDEFGWAPQTVADALKGARKKRESKQQQAQMERLRIAYLRREIDPQQATRELSAMGLEPIDIQYVLDLWSVKLASKARLPQAAQLCKAYGRGLIGFDEYTGKLVALGYSAQDVETIAGLCAEEWDEKTLKKLRAELEKAQKKQEAQNKAFQKRMEKDAKDRQKQAEKEAKDFERERRQQETDRAKQDRKEKEYWNQKRKWERENPGYRYPGTIDDNYYGPPDESMRIPEGEGETED